MRGELEAYVPTLLFVEVVNVLRYVEGLTVDDAAKAIDALQSLGLGIVDGIELLEDAIRIAFERRLTVYDSICLALVGGLVCSY